VVAAFLFRGGKGGGIFGEGVVPSEDAEGVS